MSHRPRRVPAWALSLVAVVIVSGCAGKVAPPHERAEALVDKVLDAWARGESHEQFSDPSRPLQASDPDWKDGYRLLSFLNVEAKPKEGTPDEVRCRVALSLQDRRGKAVEKEVVYAVQFGDRTVIRRE